MRMLRKIIDFKFRCATRIAAHLCMGLLGCSGVNAQSRPAIPDDSASIPQRVFTLQLHENEVISIPTNPSVTLFIQFPAVVTDYTGRGFSSDPQREAGDFYIRHVDGDSYLSIAPLTELAERTIHIVCEGRGYPIHLFPANGEYSWDKVIFIKPEPPKPVVTKERKSELEETSFSARRTLKAPRSNHLATEKLSAERLKGMIDVMRLLANLTEKKAKAVVATNPLLTLARFDRPPQDFGDFTVTQHFALRNEFYDAIGFAVSIENRGGRPIGFVPDSFTVRASEHVYHAIFTDFDPHVGGRDHVSAFFIIAGNGVGGFNDLSVDQEFSVSLDVRTKEEDRPVSTLDIPAPLGGSNAGNH